MRRILLLAVAMLFSVTSFAQTKFNVDTYHSFLNFSEGDLEMKDEDITTAKFNFTIDASSVNTGVQMRDYHLRSADFFEVETYKEIKFVSTSIKKEGSNYKLHGNLTIKNVTKPVIFDLVYGGYLKDDGQGNEKVGFQATTTIDRTAFNINYDPTGMGIAKDVKFIVNLEFTKAK